MSGRGVAQGVCADGEAEGGGGEGEARPNVKRVLKDLKAKTIQGSGCTGAPGVGL